ncbi:hypothetical protein LEP1GSC020_2213 [Leptospira interrogans serovar Grippotyphosa str. 2006006986]|nr:hypothetical protein LEP1GSC020_2213 [Leptospira interrogans serovar Grippotyphosa str. 2006006986]EKR84208.1 hypothetical protein LEP1GSC099_3194 [Leptospira interrogans str. UI 08452]EMN40879.1 hypothetical protein LEP1GSC085_4235 [Leptospira interrogans str. L0996]EMN96568.1 hypothetical protein LEP1GSC110_0567 [Leptospira interrogans serovar Medanensis str. UT053]
MLCNLNFANFKQSFLISNTIIKYSEFSQRQERIISIVILSTAAYNLSKLV